MPPHTPQLITTCEFSTSEMRDSGKVSLPAFVFYIRTKQRSGDDRLSPVTVRSPQTCTRRSAAIIFMQYDAAASCMCNVFYVESRHMWQDGIGCSAEFPNRKSDAF